jgi:hypothetical protein
MERVDAWGMRVWQRTTFMRTFGVSFGNGADSNHGDRARIPTSSGTDMRTE